MIINTDVDIFEKMTERIEQVRSDLELSRMAFCKRIGFPYARYHHITGERNSKPTADLLSAVASHTDASPDWLLSGEGPPYRTISAAQGISRGTSTVRGVGEGVRNTAIIADQAIMDSQYVLLPLYGVQGSAGEGRHVGEEVVEDLLAFKRDWITRELRSSPDDLSLIYVQGESMVPTLNPGDVILVERNQNYTISDGIYVIRMGDALLVKRLQFLPESELNVSSDNPSYQPFRVRLREEMEDFGIIGRVLWAGRRF